SRTCDMVNRTPRAGATASAARHIATPADDVEDRMIAATFVPGAISLRTSSNLPPMEVSAGGEASDVAARMRQAGNEAASDWVVNLHEYDRDAAAFLLQRSQHRRAIDQDHVWCKAHQLCRVVADAARITS